MRRFLVAGLFFSLALSCVSADDTATDELKKMEGEWIGVGFQYNGKRSSMPEIQKRVISGDQISVITLSPKDKTKALVSMKYFIRLLPDKSPKVIELRPRRDSEKAIMQGIYKWDGEMLMLCTTGFGKPLPDRFETKAGDMRTIVALKRVRGEVNHSH